MGAVQAPPAGVAVAEAEEAAAPAAALVGARDFGAQLAAHATKAVEAAAAGYDLSGVRTEGCVCVGGLSCFCLCGCMRVCVCVSVHVGAV